MAQIQWITAAGDLGTYAEAQEFSFQLRAENPLAADLKFTVISGMLPPGIQLYQSGRLYGVPSVLPTSTATGQRFSFTVRATNTRGQIADRSFSIAINGIIPPALV